MFDPNAQRRPMLAPMDNIPSNFAAPAPVTPFMEMPPPPPPQSGSGGGNGGLAGSIGAIAQLGAALGKGGGGMASKSVDAPMQMKSRRPFSVGPPFNETNA